MKTKHNLVFLIISLVIFLIPVGYAWLYPIAYQIQGRQYNIIPMTVLRITSVFLVTGLLCIQSALAAGPSQIPRSYGVLNFAVTVLESAVMIFRFYTFGFYALSLLLEMLAGSLVILVLALRR